MATLPLTPMPGGWGSDVEMMISTIFFEHDPKTAFIDTMRSSKYIERITGEPVDIFLGDDNWAHKLLYGRAPEERLRNTRYPYMAYGLALTCKWIDKNRDRISKQPSVSAYDVVVDVGYDVETFFMFAGVHAPYMRGLLELHTDIRDIIESPGRTLFDVVGDVVHSNTNMATPYSAPFPSASDLARIEAAVAVKRRNFRLDAIMAFPTRVSNALRTVADKSACAMKFLAGIRETSADRKSSFSDKELEQIRAAVRYYSSFDARMIRARAAAADCVRPSIAEQTLIEHLFLEPVERVLSYNKKEIVYTAAAEEDIVVSQIMAAMIAVYKKVYSDLVESFGYIPPICANISTDTVRSGQSRVVMKRGSYSNTSYTQQDIFLSAATKYAERMIKAHGADMCDRIRSTSITIEIVN